jgi:hypothetical protein
MPNATKKAAPHQHERLAPRDRLKKKQPILKTVLFPATDEDQQRLDAAKEAVGTARLLERDVDKAEAELKAAEDHVRETGIEMVFQGIGRRRYEELQRKYPPTEAQKKEHGEDGLAWDPDKFLPALLEETVINMGLTAAEWIEEVLDSDNWGQGEIGVIIGTAQLVNRDTRVIQLGN